MSCQGRASWLDSVAPPLAVLAWLAVMVAVHRVGEALNGGAGDVAPVASAAEVEAR